MLTEYDLLVLLFTLAQVTPIYTCSSYSYSIYAQVTPTVFTLAQVTPIVFTLAQVTASNFVLLLVHLTELACARLV